MTKEYVVVALIHPMNMGDVFESWPLHMTLVPWFTLDNKRLFMDDAQKLAKRYSRIDSVVGEVRQWGNLSVNVLERTPRLHSLHIDLLQLVRSHGQLKVREQYTGEHYTPHITHQKYTSVMKGEHVVISSIYLVEKSADSRLKKVIYRFDI